MQIRIGLNDEHSDLVIPTSESMLCIRNCLLLFCCLTRIDTNIYSCLSVVKVYDQDSEGSLFVCPAGIMKLSEIQLPQWGTLSVTWPRRKTMQVNGGLIIYQENLCNTQTQERLSEEDYPQLESSSSDSAVINVHDVPLLQILTPITQKIIYNLVHNAEQRSALYLQVCLQIILLTILWLPIFT